MPGVIIKSQTHIGNEESLSLLQRFEPILVFTRGERFFPLDIDPYVRQCSLWQKKPGEEAECLVPQGKMNLDELVKPRQARFGTIFFLKFIEPLDLVELARYSIDQAIEAIQKKDDEAVFRAGKGRLARVGYGSRFVDALFSLSLVWRGRVPGDTSAAAARAYKTIQQGNKRNTYYGRVVFDNGWIVLQYWYFYPFNNWRSGFFGVNDHEGDWEMVSIYCAHGEPFNNEMDTNWIGRVKPHWVAYASHDFSGDDLRRRWDDPELTKIEDHPVVYVGAGSHASYYQIGEYMSDIELPFLAPLVKLVDRLQTFWTKVLRQAGAEVRHSGFNVFRIPFVDYARGDGRVIGVGSEHLWEAKRFDENTSWAMEYKGLWGLYAQDPISGENAPAGPVYDRDGNFRKSWYDPLGWAGVDKLLPPEHALTQIHQQLVVMQKQNATLQDTIDSKTGELKALGLDAEALLTQYHLADVYQKNQERMSSLSAEISALREEYELNNARLKAYHQLEQDATDGYLGSMRGHIHKAHHPVMFSDLRFGVLAEIFAAISIGVLMITVVVLAIFARQYVLLGLVAFIGVLVFLEASFRKQLVRLIHGLTTGLAIVSALVLFFEFFWTIVVAGVLAAGLFIVWENLRELRH